VSQTRITQAQLVNAVALLNDVAKLPAEPWTDGKANIGNYHLSRAYGGNILHEMTNTSGACRDTFRCGYIPARELFYRIHAFLDGILEGYRISARKDDE